MMNPRSRGLVWISILTFLFLWADLVRNLSSFWSTNPQYAYGWTVPVLALFLFWECWITRPAPGPNARRGIAFLLAGILAACLLPTRLVLEATPDWRFAHWALAAEVVGLSLCAVYLGGGRAWLLHFAFPIAFIFVAVPWPTRIEQALIQTLTEWVSTLTVDGLNLCSVPAIRHGNVIEISSGMVGVEEACSGVRSFQATLMAALFLGQLWTFPWRSRLVLIGAGVVFAFLCNVVRALLLSFVAEKHGIAAIEKWHDPAGFTILGICFVGLLGLALFLRPKIGRGLSPADIRAPERLPGGLVAALAAWVVFAAVGTEWWYRSAPPGSSAWWRIEWPEKQPGFAEIPFVEKVLEMRFDVGRQAQWREEDGSQWTMFYFRWLPGLAVSRSFARWHNPDICLTSAGFKRVAEFEPVVIRQGDVELAFRTYRFDAGGQKNFVFFCVWEDRKDPGSSGIPQEWTAATHWRAVLQRKRRLGQQVIEVVIAGVKDEQAARVKFESRINAFLRPDSLLPDEEDRTGAVSQDTTAR
jgi:exosortase